MRRPVVVEVDEAHLEVAAVLAVVLVVVKDLAEGSVVSSAEVAGRLHAQVMRAILLETLSVAKG